MVQSTINLAFITLSTSLNVYATKQWSPSTDIDQWSSLALVFDQYRISKIEATLRPDFSVGVTTANLGQTTTVIDFDDGTALTGNQALDYTNAVTSSSESCQYRCFQPSVASAVYSGSAFTAFSNVPGPWIDTTSGNTLHYGLKTMSTVCSSALTLDLISRIHIEFRNCR
jgi:hypothetical protein